MNYTTIEQSKKLVELGLNPDTADMYYFLDSTPAGNTYFPSLIFIEKHLKSRMPEYSKGDIPCWSLGALLAPIPEEIKIDNLSCLAIMYLIHSNYSVRYIHDKTGDTIKETYGTTPLNAVYSMVVWLLENGYIETEKK